MHFSCLIPRFSSTVVFDLGASNKRQGQTYSQYRVPNRPLFTGSSETTEPSSEDVFNLPLEQQMMLSEVSFYQIPVTIQYLYSHGALYGYSQEVMDASIQALVEIGFIEKSNEKYIVCAPLRALNIGSLIFEHHQSS